MDAILRQLKRTAEASGGADEWRAYALALERSIGLAPSKTFAVLNDGEVTGDSRFYATDFVKYETDDTLKTLFTRYLEERFKVCEQCIDFALENEYCQCGGVDCSMCDAYEEYLNSCVDSGHECGCLRELDFICGWKPSAAWIIDEATANAVKKAGSCFPGTDSACYAQNLSLKILCRDSALETIEF